MGRNNGRLGIQRQHGSCNIDLFESKESQAEFSLLREGLTYCTCLLLEIKRAGSLFERGVSLIFKGKKMTHIISLNTTLKSLENQNASQKQHKRAAKKDF